MSVSKLLNEEKERKPRRRERKEASVTIYWPRHGEWRCDPLQFLIARLWRKLTQKSCAVTSSKRKSNLAFASPSLLIVTRIIVDKREGVDRNA